MNDQIDWRIMKTSILIAAIVVLTPVLLILAIRFISTPYFTSETTKKFNLDKYEIGQEFGEEAYECIQEFQGKYLNEGLWFVHEIEKVSVDENGILRAQIQSKTYFNIPNPRKTNISCDTNDTEGLNRIRFE